MFVVFTFVEILFCVAVVYLLKICIRSLAKINSCFQSSECDRSVRKIKISLKKFKKFLIERRKRQNFDRFVNIFAQTMNIAEIIFERFGIL